MTSDRLTDDELERIRDLADDDIATVRDMRLVLAELERLHSWDGLMELLDEKWPEDIFPSLDDDSERDPGARIVSLLRWVNTYRAVADGAHAEADRLRDENTALAAAVDQFNSFPTKPGPGHWSRSYLMGYADAARDVRAIAAALGLVQDREGQADA